MAATKQDIARWLSRGREQGATHVVVVCDTFDWEDYPIFVSPSEEAREVYSKYHGPNMQKVMEVYNLSLNDTEQLNARRVLNF